MGIEPDISGIGSVVDPLVSTETYRKGVLHYLYRTLFKNKTPNPKNVGFVFKTILKTSRSKPINLRHF